MGATIGDLMNGAIFEISVTAGDEITGLCDSTESLFRALKQ